MPIKPAHRKYYGHHWRTVPRPAILRRAGGNFDDDGRYTGGACCQRCGMADVAYISIWQRSLLECAHLDGNPADDSEENTAALCNGCHHGKKNGIDYPAWVAQYRAWKIAERERRLDQKD